MLVSSSILSANFLNLERDIKRLEAADSDFIHIDIMDGVFVANKTWGPPTIKEIKQVTALPLDVHLMIDKPERFIDHYLETEADRIIIHPESTVFLRQTLLKIKNYGVKVGVALKLETPVHTIKYCLELVDIVLLLTCDEGFGGQAFHPFSLEKISEIADLRLEQGLNFKIEVDGGINLETGRQCKEAGADILIAGSYIFKQELKTAINNLKEV